MNPEQREKAQVWNQPQMLQMIEERRYPYQRALSKVITNAFRRYVDLNAVIFEAGAGLGYLKELVPAEYHVRYITSDYNVRNLAEGAKKRKINAVAASAFELPLRDSSVGCLVDMDAYDTLPNLDQALAEARRVLMPGGIYIHFQVNFPSDDTVWDDYPDYVFFPATFEQGHRRGPMVGIKKEEFSKGLNYLHNHNPALRNFLKLFLTDFIAAYTRMINSSDPIQSSRMIQAALAVMPADRMVIPSVPNYFKEKLERVAKAAGLQVRHSQFDGTVFRGQRSKVQNKSLKSNEFSLEQGVRLHTNNPELTISPDVVEKVSLLVFVAQKPVEDLFKIFLPHS